MMLRLVSLAVALAATLPLMAKSPNVVIIYVDDMGYGDLGCYGAKDWKTPRLDALAKEGIRFTDFYVAQPVCSASRAALLTGCYPNRVGIGGALGPGAKIGINAEETTLAEVFKSKGYCTAAVGKWHLGHREEFLPTRHGFDSWLGLPYSNDMWPHHPSAKAGAYPPLPLFDDEKVIVASVDAAVQETLTSRYTERAVKFIADVGKKPFFLYVAYSMPHVPLFTTPEFRGKTRCLYGDIAQDIDTRVGQILDTLKEHKLSDDTLVIFASDNGPWLTYGDHAGTSGGLREGKGTVWEGGVRVPCVMRWPGVIPPGSVCREPAMTIDLLPTLAKVIGAELPQAKIDGLDIAPLIRAEASAKSPHSAFAFYYRDNQLQAIRSGQWKLLLPHTYLSVAGQQPGRNGKPGRSVSRKIDKPELYDLSTDVAESTDVAAKHPEVLRELLQQVEAYREDLGDSLTKRAGVNRRLPGRVP